MLKVIDTGLPQLPQPFSWAVHANGLIFTAQGPVDSGAKIAGETISEQAQLTFRNLEKTVKAAGAQLTDVAQVLIYMRSASDMAAIDEVYKTFFQAPYPNRSSVVVVGFVHPDMLIEIVAYVAVPGQ
ncbi:RidA family protein [Glaciimonas soli]|uniref:RidA family protein n=1 Tax=Glaciimonas soli TaxID=2590999 RepID=A0A843YTI0_9BURK|nr:RidA family protein [Glaciimonas soli]MQR00552.1 RidA family protein [Glaciimonas soli]